MKVCACIEVMPTAAPMPNATCSTEITRDIHHHCHQLVGQLMISSHSSGEQGRSQVKRHQLGALWRTTLEMCSDKLVKNSHTQFVSSKAEQGGTAVPDGRQQSIVANCVGQELSKASLFFQTSSNLPLLRPPHLILPRADFLLWQGLHCRHF